MIGFPVIPAVIAASVLVSQAGEPDKLSRQVRIELQVDEQEPWVGEVVDVHVRVSLERNFLRDQLVQSFRKKLGVPVQIRIPWYPELDGARAIEVGEPRGDASIVVNGALSRAVRIDPVAQGLVTFEITRSFLVERAGRLSLAPASLSFDYAERFEDSFLDGRVPIDPQKAVLESTSLVLNTRELPSVGRPKGFGGAVGSFNVRGTLATTTGVVGEPLSWTFTIEGGGNLAFFKAPVIDTQLAEFHVRGRIDRQAEGVRELVHELVPLRVVDELPAVAFTFFDPERGEYRSVRTIPIPLDIQPSADGVDLVAPPKRVVETEVEVVTELTAEPARGLGDLMAAGRVSLIVHKERISRASMAGVLIAPWILCALGVLYVRLRERGREDEATVRARQAMQALRKQLAGGDTALSEAFAEYLGAKLNCSAAAIVAADLQQRLEATGVDAALAEEVARVLLALVNEHFGREQAQTGTGVVFTLVERLESAFANEEVNQ